MCFGQTTLKFRVIYTLSSKENHLDATKSAPKNSTEKPARTVQKKNRTGGLVIYPQKLGIQSVRIPARSRTAATCRRLPRANHHPVNPQQAAEPIGAS